LEVVDEDGVGVSDVSLEEDSLGLGGGGGGEAVQSEDISSLFS
jgi:hypothetical protein